MTLTGSDYVWMTQEEITKPSHWGLHEVVLNCWWAVDKDGRVAFFNPIMGNGRRRFRRGGAPGSPQFNQQRAIVWKVAQDCAPNIFVDAVLIPVAIYKVDPRDYGE
jgi:hypothetical protein